MPYIEKQNRRKYKEYLNNIGLITENEGELNYVITKIILAFLSKKGMPRYSDYNKVLGVLESVKQELYRREVVPYEKTKKEKNGDVYKEKYTEARKSRA